MSKHAFLIITHNEFRVLQRLISALDDERIDIFIHFDKKVKEIPALGTSKSSLFILENRIDTRWGNVSQIETEFRLFAEAFSAQKYTYYHLISGVHFPVQSISSIISYYESLGDKIVFQNLNKDATWQEEMKVHHFNLLTRHYAYGSKMNKRLVQVIWRYSNELQKLCGINRFSRTVFYKANNWATFSNEALRYLLERKEEILDMYRWSFCGDEYFAPTLFMNSCLKSKIVNDEHVLYQIFGEANPRVLTVNDYDSIVSSNCLFIRKVSEKEMGLIDMLISNSK